MDVCGIGSALVDILVEATPDQVEACGLIKGSMQLMERDAADKVHAAAPGGIEASGGSCANTIAGLAVLGADAAFIGRVADDRYGQVFSDGLTQLGVTFAGNGRAPSPEWATGRSLVLVTPDADRTMCTTLGVAPHLGIDHLDESLISSAAVTYLEGYLWDQPIAIDALRTAISTAHAAGRLVAMSLSDPFCVDRHRSAWVDLVASDLDLVFGNESELCSLTSTSSLSAACSAVQRPGLTVTVTRGALGAWTFSGPSDIVETPAAPVDRVVDTTGAGDLYAAGFLYGLTRGFDLSTCAQLGAVCAGEVISHVGARPLADLKALVEPLIP